MWSHSAIVKVPAEEMCRTVGTTPSERVSFGDNPGGREESRRGCKVCG